VEILRGGVPQLTWARITRGLGPVWLVVALLSVAFDGPAGVSEAALKAAFLLNFAKFAEWPSDVRPATGPLVLCSADQAVSPLLETTVAGQTVEQRPVSAVRVTLDEPLQDCALLYVGKIDRPKVAELTQTLNGSAVLTVGDEQAFASAGGMIGFFVEDGRMRFAVNVAAAERGRVRLSAKLLTLARIVKD
jgi:hypothetical protein